MSHDHLTLNDIAALIVQIEPTDLAGLAHVRGALHAIMESSPTSVQKPISEVLKKIDQTAEGEAPDPSGLPAEIGVLTEEAIDAMEKSAGEETSASGPEHDPVPMAESSVERGRFNALP